MAENSEIAPPWEKPPSNIQRGREDRTDRSLTEHNPGRVDASIDLFLDERVKILS